MNHLTLLYIVLYLFYYLSCSKGCIELLNGQWSQMSVEERTERSEVVIVMKVLKKLPSNSKTSKFYSGTCIILDVLKGWEYFKKDDKLQHGWEDKKIINIYGFGSALNCLSDVQENNFYVLFGMFKVDQNLWASYFTSFGAVEAVTNEVYDKVSSTLGLHKWSKWSVCSKECGVGDQKKTRTCVLNSNCDYSWNLIKRNCNWQGCDKMILHNFDLHSKNDLLLKNTKLNKSKQIMIYIEFKNTQPNSSNKRKQSFVFKMIDIKNGIVTLTLTSNGIIQIDFEKTSKSDRLSLNIIDKIMNDGMKFNIFINKTNIIFEHSCETKIKNQLKHFLQSFFTKLDSQISWNMSDDVIASLSEETLDNYQNINCQYKKYNHSTNLNVMLQEDKKYVNFKETKSKTVIKPIWSTWSKCSISCGIGWQKREKECHNEECEIDKNVSEIRTCYIQKKCFENSCSQLCKNGGQCIKMKCFCENGFHGEYCEKPICLDKCKNNGICISPNNCQCTEGYEGRLCEIPKCEIKCLNDGQCLEPNVCTCTFGFEGALCEKRKCSPDCQNNGVCQQNNFCKCPPGVIGSRCEKYECYPQCMNGGICVGVNKCKCPDGFLGLYCEKHICNQCYNGGKCVDHSCQCPLGFYGDQCQSKICVAGLKFQKLIKPVIIHFPGTMNNKICLDSNCKLIRPQRSVIVNKVVFKPYIDCL